MGPHVARFRRQAICLDARFCRRNKDLVAAQRGPVGRASEGVARWRFWKPAFKRLHAILTSVSKVVLDLTWLFLAFLAGFGGDGMDGCVCGLCCLA